MTRVRAIHSPRATAAVSAEPSASEVMAPSSTDQTPGRPSQPLRSTPLNSDRKPGSMTGETAFRSAPAIAASASRIRLPKPHRPVFIMPISFPRPARRYHDAPLRPKGTSSSRPGVEEPQVYPDPATETVRGHELDASARGTNVGHPIEPQRDRGHPHDVANRGGPDPVQGEGGGDASPAK